MSVLYWELEKQRSTVQSVESTVGFAHPSIAFPARRPSSPTETGQTKMDPSSMVAGKDVIPPLSSRKRTLRQTFVPQRRFLGRIVSCSGEQIEAEISDSTGARLIYAFEADNLPEMQRGRVEIGASVTVQYGYRLRGSTKENGFQVYLNLSDENAERAAQKLAKIVGRWNF